MAVQEATFYFDAFDVAETLAMDLGIDVDDIVGTTPIEVYWTGGDEIAVTFDVEVRD